MLATRLWALLAAALVAGAPAIARADQTLTVVAGGEGFDGPPEFAVSFAGQPLGTAAVEAAIDTHSEGRFADAANRAAYVQKFTFNVPDGLFKPDGLVEIRLNNGARGAPGSKDARELFVRSVGVGDTTIDASSLSMRSAAGVEPTAMLGDYLVVSQNDIEAIGVPSGGWMTAVASNDRTASPPAEAEPAVAETAAADAAPQPATPEDPGCRLDRKFQVTGFSRNSNDLTPASRKMLDEVVKAIGQQKCVVHLTGYSSTEGDYAHNALFSIERSQNALHYLAARGVQFRRYSANGVGETTQFGPTAGANRRVVIAVSP